MNQKIVARMTDGQVLKGYALNFSPIRDTFHLRLLDSAPGEKPLEVAMNNLKAIFFVKTFEGDASYNERKTFMPGEKAYGKKINVSFCDGESMACTSTAYNLDRTGFFMYPVDSKSNNERIFAISSCITNLEELTM